MTESYARFSAPTHLDQLRVIVKFTNYPSEDPVEVWQADFSWGGEGEELNLEEVVNDVRAIAMNGDRAASHTLDVHASETHWGATGIADTITIAVTTAILSTAGTDAVKAAFARIGKRCMTRSRNFPIDPSRVTAEGRLKINLIYPSVQANELVVQEETYDAEAGTARVVYRLPALGDVYTVDFGVTKHAPTALRITRSSGSVS
ncbi:MAG TPA: hypothetical protein VGE93_04720 [Bryobacteraceae bacterium]